MATQEKEQGNRVQGMNVPKWVTEYYKWTATLGSFMLCLIVTLILLICVLVFGSSRSLEDKLPFLDFLKLFAPCAFVGIIASLIYAVHGIRKRTRARAYAKAELIAILGIKDGHYCKAVVEQGLAHLAHATTQADAQSCNPDLLCGAFAKARALARLEFDFPAFKEKGDTDILDKTSLIALYPLHSCLCKDYHGLDNRWLHLARILQVAESNASVSENDGVIREEDL